MVIMKSVHKPFLLFILLCLLFLDLFLRFLLFRLGLRPLMLEPIRRSPWQLTCPQCAGHLGLPKVEAAPTVPTWRGLNQWRSLKEKRPWP